MGVEDKSTAEAKFEIEKEKRAQKLKTDRYAHFLGKPWCGLRA